MKKIEMTTLENENRYGKWFSFASPIDGNGGEVTTPHYKRKALAERECLRMARAVWGEVEVIEVRCTECGWMGMEGDLHTETRETEGGRFVDDGLCPACGSEEIE